VLIVDKPKGPTSHDIVSAVRRFLKVKRVGHTGTLDPMATGVLVICLGEATKLAGYLTADDKAYETTVRLGIATDTHDAEGEITSERPVEVSEASVEAALATFRGQIAQVPPMYSALKKDGERLYKLAREGKVVEREPRTVQIHSLILTRFEPPELDLALVCGKGTYVRTIAHDLGELLGCGAHLSKLTRTRSGVFDLEKAVPFEEIRRARDLESREAVLEKRMSMSEALSNWPAVHVNRLSASNLRQGRGLGLGDLATGGGGGLRPGQLARVIDENQALVALGEIRALGLHPIRVFAKDS